MILAGVSVVPGKMMRSSRMALATLSLPWKPFIVSSVPKCARSESGAVDLATCTKSHVQCHVVCVCVWSYRSLGGSEHSAPRLDGVDLAQRHRHQRPAGHERGQTLEEEAAFVLAVELLRVRHAELEFLLRYDLEAQL